MNKHMSTLIVRMSHFLATQMAVCVNEQGRCIYKNDSGQRCIIGCTLPRHLLERIHASGLGAHELYLREPTFAEALHLRLPDNTYEERINFLKRCQEYHDEDYGYAHDIRQLLREKAEYMQRYTTIRRRIKKFVDGEFDRSSL